MLTTTTVSVDWYYTRITYLGSRYSLTHPGNICLLSSCFKWAVKQPSLKSWWKQFISITTAVLFYDVSETATWVLKQTNPSCFPKQALHLVFSREYIWFNWLTSFTNSLLDLHWKICFNLFLCWVFLNITKARTA